MRQCPIASEHTQRSLRGPEKPRAMSMFATPKIVFFFKPVPGGFVYAAPNPWGVGRTKHYFVTATQRDEVTAASQLPPVIGMFAVLMVVMMLGVGAAMALIFYRHSFYLEQLTTGDTMFMLAALALSMLSAVRIAFRSRTNRLRTLLASLPTSDVRITRADIRRATLEMFSAKQLWLQSVLAVVSIGVCGWLIIFKFNHGREALSADPLSILLLIGACVAAWGLIAQLRLAVEKTIEETRR